MTMIDIKFLDQTIQNCSGWWKVSAWLVWNEFHDDTRWFEHSSWFGGAVFQVCLRCMSGGVDRRNNAQVNLISLNLFDKWIRSGVEHEKPSCKKKNDAASLVLPCWFLPFVMSVFPSAPCVTMDTDEYKWWIMDCHFWTTIWSKCCHGNTTTQLTTQFTTHYLVCKVCHTQGQRKRCPKPPWQNVVFNGKVWLIHYLVCSLLGDYTVCWNGCLVEQWVDGHRADCVRFLCHAWVHRTLPFPKKYSSMVPETEQNADTNARPQNTSPSFCFVPTSSNKCKMRRYFLT